MLLVSGMNTEISAKTITEFYQWETEGFIPPIAKPEQEFLDPGMSFSSFALSSSFFYLFYFFYLGLTALQDYFTNFEQSQSLRWGENERSPRKKHLTTRKQNLACLTYDPS